ncbi:hypothetical protein LXL04_024088 [Taraxacum kok-saghyz]
MHQIGAREGKVVPMMGDTPSYQRSYQIAYGFLAECWFERDSDPKRTEGVVSPVVDAKIRMQEEVSDPFRSRSEAMIYKSQSNSLCFTNNSYAFCFYLNIPAKYSKTHIRFLQIILTRRHGPIYRPKNGLPDIPPTSNPESPNFPLEFTMVRSIDVAFITDEAMM